MHDRLENFPAAFRLSQRARRIIRQNLLISLGTVVVLVTFALLGRIPLTIGVVGHEGSTVVVVMNSLRLLFRSSRGESLICRSCGADSISIYPTLHPSTNPSIRGFARRHNPA